MRTKLLIVAAIMLLATPAFATWTVSGSDVVDTYKDQMGEHNLIKITVVGDGSAGSFSYSDLSQTVRMVFRGYIYWVGIDPVGTLTTAPQITITDKYGFVQFANTTLFEVTNSIKVLGNSYDGQYPHITNGDVFSFNDIGAAAESFILYLDLVR